MKTAPQLCRAATQKWNIFMFCFVWPGLLTFELHSVKGEMDWAALKSVWLPCGYTLYIAPPDLSGSGGIEPDGDAAAWTSKGSGRPSNAGLSQTKKSLTIFIFHFYSCLFIPLNWTCGNMVMDSCNIKEEHCSSADSVGRIGTGNDCSRVLIHSSELVRAGNAKVVYWIPTGITFECTHCTVSHFV